ncbi:MAG: flagellar protein FliT [Verrucomicrobiota bacterium]
MNAEQDEAKTKLLREVFETVMWELDAARQGRWETLPEWREKRQALVKRMEKFDWTPASVEDQNPELYMLQKQIIDLEYQLRKIIESNMAVFKAQLKDLEERSQRWRTVLNPYKLNAV